MRFLLLYIIMAGLLVSGCGSPANKPLFDLLDHTQTGLGFRNDLRPTPAFNMFHYMYFYNGAGVGAGDFNNDGKIDLFFASNQGQNKLYLNGGDLRFTDVTEKTGIRSNGGWSTGVSVVDINDDGLLDIYICQVGRFESLKGENQLLVCQGIRDGIPQYKEMAADYGLDFSGFSTQAAFFDMDLDGDLDMFLLNHSVHHNGTFGKREIFKNTIHEQSGDRLYRNDNGHFVNITASAGINSSAIGYGLGVSIADINLDGYPDIYVGNDFHENDYLYINQGNGRFSEEAEKRLMHTSQFSMGVDVADINNDALPDIASMDMLPEDPYILRRSLGEDEYNIFQMKIGYGYSYQYTRNNLQLNRGNGMFSEVGLYAGIAATDWSWAPLWIDFDNDGLKDLFVSNGIPKRLNDIDYVNYITNHAIQERIRNKQVSDEDMKAVEQFPEIKLPNRFFRNKGNAVFEKMQNAIGNEKVSFSNGAIYADFDNDGDIDIVVNNINDPVMFYRNNSRAATNNHAVTLKLAGPRGNRNALGASVAVYKNDTVSTYEKFPVHGFLSSVESPLTIGLGNRRPDSMVLRWPDGKVQHISISAWDSAYVISYSPDAPVAPERHRLFPFDTVSVEEIATSLGLRYRHRENSFVEFDREALLPHMQSTEGPALAIGDVNGDGREDVFVGAARRFPAALFVQTPGGSFVRSPQPAVVADSMYEDVDAVWADLNNDNAPDLLVASGGNEFYGRDSMLLPRVYLNDTKGNLHRVHDAFDGVYVNASVVATADINNDGYIDVFVGARDQPYQYGKIPESWLLLNDGTGRFKAADGWMDKKLGLVKDACWIDIDGDRDPDLVLALEWNGIMALVNQKGHFEKKWIAEQKGWWNCIVPVDVNKDGRVDFIAGNLGYNSRLKATKETPVRLYVSDFDGNGQVEQVMSYVLDGKEIPFANKMELERQLPLLKKKYLYAADFARAGMNELFDPAILKRADTLYADYFGSVLLTNKGNGRFEASVLPWQAQLSPLMSADTCDIDSDGWPDILLGCNYYDNNIQLGRYDADFGSVLLNDRRGGFQYRQFSRPLAGQVRKIKALHYAGGKYYVEAVNNDSLRVIRFNKQDKPSLR